MSTAKDKTTETDTAIEAKRDRALSARAALKEAVEKVARLDSRKRDLTGERDQHQFELDRARRALDDAAEKAAIEGDSAAYKEAREQVAKAKQAVEDANEQIAALERATPRAKEEVNAALDQARKAHRIYWKAVEEQEKEKAKELAEVLVRAYAAYTAAQEPSMNTPKLGQWLSGNSLSAGVLAEVGVTRQAVDDLDFASEVPQDWPFAPHSATG